MDLGLRHIALPPQILDASLLGALLEEIDEGIYVVDRERRILYWNHGAEKITGYLAQEVRGRLCHSDMLMHCDLDGAVLCGAGCPLAEVIQDGIPREVTVFLRHRHGHRIPVRVRARTLRDAQGQITGAVELFEMAVAPGRLDGPFSSLPGVTGEVTGAAGREYAEWRLVQALATMRRFDAPVGWVAVALDRSEEWEHRFGHGFVEAAMAMVARTIDANLGSRDVLARWSRTEFRVLVDHASPHDLAGLAKKLGVLVRASNLEWWGDPQRVTVSVAGAPASPEDSVQSLEGRVRKLLDDLTGRAVGQTGTTPATSV